MRIFAISDLHVDYDDNAKWVKNLSSYDFANDVLIIAGDTSNWLTLQEWTLKALVRRFKAVLSRQEIWMDYHACLWPDHRHMEDVSAYFERKNLLTELNKGEMVITFSHFLPRIDILPSFIPAKRRILNPILGAAWIDRKIRKLISRIHVYGHSHINQCMEIDGVTYMNNAFGYPRKSWITTKKLLRIQAP